MCCKDCKRSYVWGAQTISWIYRGLPKGICITTATSLNKHDTGRSHYYYRSLSITQLLNFNSIKHRRKESTTEAISVRHSTAQETPVPTYVGLTLHGHTRKKELVDRLYHLGLNISYDRVLRLSAQVGNRVCKQWSCSLPSKITW